MEQEAIIRWVSHWAIPNTVLSEFTHLASLHLTLILFLTTVKVIQWPQRLVKQRKNNARKQHPRVPASFCASRGKTWRPLGWDENITLPHLTPCSFLFFPHRLTSATKSVYDIVLPLNDLVLCKKLSCYSYIIKEVQAQWHPERLAHLDLLSETQDNQAQMKPEPRRKSWWRICTSKIGIMCPRRHSSKVLMNTVRTQTRRHR